MFVCMPLPAGALVFVRIHQSAWDLDVHAHLFDQSVRYRQGASVHILEDLTSRDSGVRAESQRIEMVTVHQILRRQK